MTTGDDAARGATGVYVLDREAVRSVDRAAIEEFGIPGLVLMENAARALHAAAREMLGDDRAGTVLIVCGKGNNGGDGWALARHLVNEGRRPVIAALGDSSPDTDAGVNQAICGRMGVERVPVDRIDDHRDAALIVDAIFGTGLTGDVRGRPAEVIAWINGTGRPVLAVDVPSGLDCDTGRPLGTCVRADRTVSFVGMKPGFLAPEAEALTGKVVIGDIGAPATLTARFGRPLASFRAGSVPPA